MKLLLAVLLFWAFWNDWIVWIHSGLLWAWGTQPESMPAWCVAGTVG